MLKLDEKQNIFNTPIERSGNIINLPLPIELFGLEAFIRSLIYVLTGLKIFHYTQRLIKI